MEKDIRSRKKQSRHNQRGRRETVSQGRSRRLTWIGSVLTLFLPSAGEDNEFHQICEAAEDAARLIVDASKSHSEHMRILLGTGLNNKFKKTLNDAHIDQWLFGTNLGEKLKSAKFLE